MGNGVNAQGGRESVAFGTGGHNEKTGFLKGKKMRLQNRSFLDNGAAE